MNSPFIRPGRRALPIIIALLIGLMLVAALIALRKTPERVDVAETITPVRYIKAQALPFVAQARGFGAVTPARHWLAVSSVEGKVVQRHPQLDSGSLLAAGTELLQIDPSRYRLAVAEAAAEADGLRAELAQLGQDADNTRELLDMERQRLALAETELARIRKLATSGTVTASRTDEQLRATLAQRQAVKTLESRLLLVPSQTQRIEAQLERIATRQQQAQQDLADTRILAPFDLRVDEVHVEQGQHISRAQVLMSGDGIDAAEVVLQLPLHVMRTLIATLPTAAPPTSHASSHAPPHDTQPGSAQDAPGDTADTLKLSDTQNLADPGALPVLARHADLTALQAELRLASDRTVRWPAHVTRIANRIDPITRTVQVVLSVAEPYRRAAPPQRPPLVAGMYVEGVLWAAADKPGVVIPATALHHGEVYVADASGRLQRRTVTPLLTQRDFVILDGGTVAGVAAGERVIIDELLPAIDGMALELHHAPDAQARLQRAAMEPTQ